MMLRTALRGRCSTTRCAPHGHPTHGQRCVFANSARRHGFVATAPLHDRSAR